MFNQVTYNVLIERFKAFANGHYKIERFSHGQIDVTDIDKEQRFPWMHVVPVSIQPSNGSRSFSLDVVFADMPRDKENKTEYQRESLSDCIQLAEDLLAEIKNGGIIFGEDVTLEEGSAVQPFMEEYTHVLTGVTLSLTITFPWNWNACDIPADWTTGGRGGGGTGGGGGTSILLKVNDVDNVIQTILNLTAGVNMTITDMGDGRVKFDATGDIGTTWGSIGGLLADQIDLQSALDLKADIASLADVAFSGDYNDLSNTPTIPTATSELTNDSGFITIADVPTQVQSDWNQTDSGEVDFIKNKPTIPDSSTFVPYTGATSNVNIGVKSIIADNGSDNSEMSPTLFGVQNDAGTKYSYLDKTGLNVTDSDAGNNMNVNAGGLTFPDATSQYSAAVNADWNASTGLAQILNKPTIPAAQVNADWNASSGVAQILNKPTIPAAQIQSDWNQTNNASLDFIKNKPTLPSTIGDMTKAVYDTDNDGIVDFAEALKTEVRNSTGVVLRKGHIIYLSGSTGNLPNAVYAQANSEATSAQTFGVVLEDIANNSNGYVVTIGQINTLDTRTTATNPFTSDTLVDGQVIYLSPTTAGHITNVKPVAPNHIVYVGYVIRTSPTNGTIQYRIQNGYELDEIHDVAIASPVSKDLLTYNGTGLWINKAVDSSWLADRTTVGAALFALANPSAIRYLRVNADNSIATLTLAQLKTELGLSRAVLTSDVTITALVTTLSDITGLSFPIVAGNSYKFRAELYITASVSNIGLKLSINANVAVTQVVFRAVSASATESGQYVHNGIGLDSVSATNVGSIRSSNYATVEGILIANNTGTAILRFGKAGANTGTLAIKASSFVEYQTI